MVLAPTATSLNMLHDRAIKAYGVEGFMHEGMVQGSIERAMANVYDFQPFSSFFMKAAALLYSIIRFHPYNDGNKRTAIMGTITFLNYNGYEFIASEDETFDMARAIADRKVTDI